MNVQNNIKLVQVIAIIYYIQQRNYFLTMSSILFRVHKSLATLLWCQTSMRNLYLCQPRHAWRAWPWAYELDLVVPASVRSIVMIPACSSTLHIASHCLSNISIILSRASESLGILYRLDWSISGKDWSHELFHNHSSQMGCLCPATEFHSTLHN